MSNSGTEQAAAELLIPRYLNQMVQYLKAQEQELWQWFSRRQHEPEHMDQQRLELLKTTFRLDADSHAELYRQGQEVAQVLGLQVPITFYQAQTSTELNAAIPFIPGEAHIIFYGPVQENLNPLELKALIAHELCHLMLWQCQGQDFLLAEQILSALNSDQNSSHSHYQSCRLFQLFVEICCDRAALAAGCSLYDVVAMIIKVTTGLKTAQPESYLIQAREVLQQENSGSQSYSHPESFMRARALELYQDAPSQLNAKAEYEIEQIIRGEQSLSRLDLQAREEMAATSREWLMHLLQASWMQSELLLSQAKLYFDDFTVQAPEIDEPALLLKLRSKDPDINKFLAYVLLDFATADSSLEDLPLALCSQWAGKLDIAELFAETVVKELPINKRQYNKILSSAKDKLAAQSGNES